MLRPIPIERLRVGARLPGPLRDRWGRVLIKADVCLNEKDVARIHARAEFGLFGGSDWFDDRERGGSASKRVDTHVESIPSNPPPEPPKRIEVASIARDETISVASLRRGTRLKQDICDEGSVLLLAAGTEITPRFLQLIRQRGLTTVTLKSRTAPLPARKSQKVTAAEIDWLIQEKLKHPVRFRPLGKIDRPRLSLSNLKVEAHRGVKKLNATRSAIAELWDTLMNGRTASHALVRTTVEEFADLTRLDLDLLPLIVSMQENSASPDFLFEHSPSVSLMSMSIAAQLGLNREQISEVGLGALFQDIGMMRVPEEIRFAARPLTSEEWVEVRHHPIYTLDILDNIRGLPDTVKIIAYQSHERGDQSGYPRQRSDMYVHQFAKITAVADAYVAMSRARPHREAFTPYAACKAILKDGNADKFDRTIVRALLDTLSLFPIGSIVELNNGSRAKVIRANPGFHTSPIVYELHRDDTPTGRVIDLSKETRLRIVSAR